MPLPDAAVIGDPGHVADHNAIVDALGTLQTDVAGKAATVHSHSYDPDGTAAAAVAAHEALPDPHAQYETSAEATAKVTAHSGATDPHGDRAHAAGLVATHEADTTSVHGIADTSALVLTGDARLADARTPTAHKTSHATGGSDALTAADIGAAAASHAHTAANVSDFAEVVRDTMGTALVAGSGITVTPNDGADTITIAATGGGGSALTVVDESTTLTTAATKITFAGAGVTATEPVADEILVTIAGGGSGTPWTEGTADPTGGAAGDWYAQNAVDKQVTWRNNAGTWQRRGRLSRFASTQTTLIANGLQTPWGVYETTLTDLCDVIATGTTQTGAVVNLSTTSTNPCYRSSGFVGTEDANAAFTVIVLPSTGHIEFGIPVNISNVLFIGFVRVTSAGVATAVSYTTTKFTFGTTVNTATQAGTVFAQVVMKGGILFAQLNGASHATAPNAVVDSVLMPDQYAVGQNLYQYGVSPFFRGSGSGTQAKVSVDSMEYNG